MAIGYAISVFLAIPLLLFMPSLQGRQQGYFLNNGLR